MTENTQTEVVPVDRFADLQPGDVVVDTDRTYDGDLVRVRRVLLPKPSLPTTNGSIVTPDIATGQAVRPLSAFLHDGAWFDAAYPSDRLYPDIWASGWTLIYEAPSTLTLPTRSVLSAAIWWAAKPYDGGVTAAVSNIVADSILELLKGDE